MYDPYVKSASTYPYEYSGEFMKYFLSYFDDISEIVTLNQHTFKTDEIFLMKGAQISVLLIVSVLAIAMRTVAALRSLEHNQAKALILNLEEEISFIHIDANHLINLK